MRRLLQHALVGVGVSAVAAGVVVSGLGGPSAGSTTIAVPAPVVSIEQPAALGPAVEAERAARQAEQDRSAARAQLTATAIAQAGKRSAALADQSRSITRQQARIAADRRAEAAAAKVRAAQEKRRAAQEKERAAKAAARAEAAARAAAAAKAAQQEAARARAAQVRAQGYEPGTTDPRDIARQILQNKYGYGADQFSCFNDIIIRESGWDVDATNASSGAYGIPQALPGSKMASVAGDWRTNPATQIIWAVGYMQDRYGSPCQAWSFKSANGWY